MSVQFELAAEPRHAVGKGASRRLRRAGKVPAVIYGAKKDAQHLSLTQNDLIHQLDNEAFYSSILDVKIGGQSERAILRDLQRHPYKPSILHVDLQRVSEDVEIRVHVPLHFLNEENCRGVKQEGGAISHMVIEVEVSCLPRHLPEYIEVDVADLGLGDTIHLSEIKLPEGVTLTQLAQGPDAIVANVHHVHTIEEPEETEEGVEGAPETPEAPQPDSAGDSDGGDDA